VDTSATAADPRHLLEGKVIGGNYRVDRLIGHGGMGAVYQARQLSLDRDVALKLLLTPLAMDRTVLERFQREARAASNIGHPGIIQIFDMGYLEDGAPFMVMEFLEGEDLRHLLRRQGAMDLNLAVPIIVQICDALQAAHDKGIVHRDLKPDNLFLVYRRDKVPMVKLLDFGLSKVKSSDKPLTGTGTIIGTPNYMAPEQITAEIDVDHRADVYGAGVILYEMLTGCMAYEGASVQNVLMKIISTPPMPPSRLNPSIPQDLEGVILKAMARSPQDRYASMSAMSADLVRIGSSAGIPRSDMSLVPTGAVEPVVPHASSGLPPAAAGYPSPAHVISPTPSPYGAYSPPYSPYSPAPASPPLPAKKKKGMSPAGVIFLILGVFVLLGLFVTGLAVVGMVMLEKKEAKQPKEKVIPMDESELGEYISEEEAEALGVQ
jgi:serine/threonine-protein kinase